MQYILQEDEYKDLIPKSKIKGPIDEFLKRVIGSARPVDSYDAGRNNILEIEAGSFRSAYGKLKSALEGLLSNEQPKT
jgi:hypothetical protein